VHGGAFGFGSGKRFAEALNELIVGWCFVIYFSDTVYVVEGGAHDTFSFV